MLPLDGLSAGALESDYLYANNAQAERSFCCGGNYAYGSNAGVFCAYGYYSRANTGTSISLRSAYPHVRYCIPTGLLSVQGYIRDLYLLRLKYQSRINVQAMYAVI